MSPARRAARAGRNLLIALLVGAIVIVAIVVAYVASRPTSTPSVLPGTPTTTTRSAGSSSDIADAAPTGCLGGPSRTNEMLLTAQRLASHTTYGAVEVAAAFFRWAYRYPFPKSSESDQISKQFVAPRASSEVKDISGSFARAGDISGGEVPEGAPFYLSTATGGWLVDQRSTDDEVTVQLEGAYVVDGALSATRTAAISATLVWTAGEWRLLRQQAPDASALAAGGTRFTAGC